MTDREKALFELHKQFLHLHYKVSEYEIAGIDPPDYLKEKFNDIERKMRLVSKALD